MVGNFRETCFKVMFVGMAVLWWVFMSVFSVIQQKIMIQIQLNGVWHFLKHFNLNTILYFCFNTLK
jgi:hypothetical protein